MNPAETKGGASLFSPLTTANSPLTTDGMDAYTDLIHRVKETFLLRSCADVLGWDERTYMPPGGAPFRAEQMALLARMAHEMTTAPFIGELLARLEGSAIVRDPDSLEAANVREIRRAYERAVKLPKRL